MRKSSGLKSLLGGGVFVISASFTSTNEGKAKRGKNKSGATREHIASTPLSLRMKEASKFGCPARSSGGQRIERDGDAVAARRVHVAAYDSPVGVPPSGGAFGREEDADLLAAGDGHVGGRGQTAERQVAQREAQVRHLPGVAGVVEALALDADVDFLAREHSPLGAARAGRHGGGDRHAARLVSD